jgi:hypothetical protein
MAIGPAAAEANARFSDVLLRRTKITTASGIANRTALCQLTLKAHQVTFSEFACFDFPLGELDVATLANNLHCATEAIGTWPPLAKVLVLPPTL